MNSSQLFELWAPDASIWSPWAKPVLFAGASFLGGEPEQSNQWQAITLNWAPPARDTAIILDLPGPMAIWFGIALGERGYRPVPLYNGVPGPSALIDVNPIRMALHEVEGPLTDFLTRLPADAPPAFLLDAHRSAGAFAGPGLFDNRWCVFPQDFPSANLLLSRGIQKALLVQYDSTTPKSDLSHVLLRWQQKQIQILTFSLNAPAQPAPIQVAKPRNFGAIWYFALALAGFRRNSAGGFGSVIPQPSSGGGFG
jgi:hypothetical protein